jgi:hypothetical protein
MNANEPVGTVIEIEEVYGHTFKKRKRKVVQWAKEIDVGTKLYTHPIKELTDEEIMSLSYLTSDNDPIEFARAILRKAQE